jgi:hypothetical protein
VLLISASAIFPEFERMNLIKTAQIILEFQPNEFLEMSYGVFMAD